VGLEFVGELLGHAWSGAVVDREEASAEDGFLVASHGGDWSLGKGLFVIIRINQSSK
jgi:hypothetical protein